MVLPSCVIADEELRGSLEADKNIKVTEVKKFETSAMLAQGFKRKMPTQRYKITERG